VKNKRSNDNQKRLIADEAARILAEQSDLSLGQAKQKAAQQLGYGGRVPLPDNTEVELALRSYQQLFQRQSQPDELARLRHLALQAMRTFAPFDPKLVGDICSGIANQHSAIQLRLFCDTVEEVVFYLIDKKIPWREREISCYYSDQKAYKRPLISFSAGDTHVELLLLPLKDKKNPPLDFLGGAPVRGMTIEELKQLLT